jgi:hypothetical protein
MIIQIDPDPRGRSRSDVPGRLGPPGGTSSIDPAPPLSDAKAVPARRPARKRRHNRYIPTWKARPAGRRGCRPSPRQLAHSRADVTLARIGGLPACGTLVRTAPLRPAASYDRLGRAATPTPAGRRQLFEQERARDALWSSGSAARWSAGPVGRRRDRA